MRENLLIIEMVNDYLMSPERNHQLNKYKIPVDTKITDIKFNDIDFGYRNKELLFKNKSLEFKNNKINYFKGKNDFGKSSLVKILLGLSMPAKGEMLINTTNGVLNLKEINLKHWREQNVAFFNSDTLYEITKNQCF